MALVFYFLAGLSEQTVLFDRHHANHIVVKCQALLEGITLLCIQVLANTETHY